MPFTLADFVFFQLLKTRYVSLCELSVINERELVVLLVSLVIVLYTLLHSDLEK
jgi:hypothetical protein